MQRLAMRNALRALAVLAVLGFADSARAHTLTAGNDYQATYNISAPAITGDTSAGAGDFKNAILDGGNLPFMYCVDLTHVIYPGAGTTDNGNNSNGFYDDVKLNYSGLAAPAGGYITDFAGGLPQVNAAAISWLIENVQGSTHGTFTPSAEATMALQAAIWNVEYNAPKPGTGWTDAAGQTFNLVSFSGGVNDTTAKGDYQSDLAGVSGAYILQHNSLAMVPGTIFINLINEPANPYGLFGQAQVTSGPAPDIATPVPANLVMSAILLGMFGMVWSYQRINQRKAAA